MHIIDPALFIKSSFAAFSSTLFCIWILRPVACRIGLIDSPGGRKWHESDVPLIGGITMFFGFCFALLILPFSLYEYRGLLAGSGLLIFIGVVDDFRELGSKLRLLCQLFACFFLIAWGQKTVSSLGDLTFLGNLHLGVWCIPITVIAVVGFINAMNMIDGQDGLAGGVALTQILSLLFLSFSLERSNDTLLLGIIAVLISTFLLFNMPTPWRPYARVFLGDAGSTFIAFVIAWFAVDFSQAESPQIKPITILWVLALPLFDLINVCTYRISRGISPFMAGRDHLHHLLHWKGIDKTMSTFLLCLFSALFGMTGLTFSHFSVPESVSFMIYMSCLACYLIFIKVLRDEREQIQQSTRMQHVINETAVEAK